MKIANARLQLDEHGSDVPMKDITPAEVVMLAIIHTPNVQDFPFEDFTDIRDSKLTDIDLKRYLVTKYGREAVNKVFPGAKPSFPVDFKEAKEIAMESSATGDTAGKGADLLGAKEQYEAAIKIADTAKAAESKPDKK